MPFYYGWDDPFWYGGGVDSYTVYVSHLDLDIRRRVDNASLFEGHAKARSRTDELNRLVPNLVEAMFTGFPGRSGETIKITVRRRPSAQAEPATGEGAKGGPARHEAGRAFFSLVWDG